MLQGYGWYENLHKGMPLILLKGKVLNIQKIIK